MFRYKLIVVALGFSLLANCETLPQAKLRASPSRAMATAPLEDVSYSFDSSKLGAAKSAFSFQRTFVDYFYLLVQKNESQLNVAKLKNFSGWCVGDAHPENFGLLQLQDQSHIFTMNDMDDAGPCPVFYDVYRLATASQLYSSSISVQQILSSYTKGVSGQSVSVPDTVNSMSSKALKRGQVPDPKNLVGNKFDPSFGEIPDEATAQEVRSAIALMLPQARVLDILKTAKVGGGSGGSVRFEVLLQNNAQLLHLELKQQFKPSIYPVATQPLDSTQVRLAKTLMTEQGPGHSLLYGYVKIQGMDMLVRPRFWGDEGMKLAKNTDSENEQMIYFEAYVLGQIHRRTVNNLPQYIQELSAFDPAALSEDVSAMKAQMEKRFSAP